MTHWRVLGRPTTASWSLLLWAGVGVMVGGGLLLAVQRSLLRQHAQVARERARERTRRRIVGELRRIARLHRTRKVAGGMEGALPTMPGPRQLMMLNEQLLRLLEDLDAVRPGAVVEGEGAGGPRSASSGGQPDSGVDPQAEALIQGLRERKRLLVASIQRSMTQVDALLASTREAERAPPA